MRPSRPLIQAASVRGFMDPLVTGDEAKASTMRISSARSMSPKMQWWYEDHFG